MSSDRIKVETATESAIKSALHVAAVLALFAIAGFVVLVCYNVVTLPVRRWFRAIPLTPASWFAGLLIGAGIGWGPAHHDTHPDLAAWWPLVLTLTILILRLETVGYRAAQREATHEDDQ